MHRVQPGLPGLSACSYAGADRLIMRQLWLFFSPRNNWITCLKFYGDNVWIPVCVYAKGIVWMAVILW